MRKIKLPTDRTVFSTDNNGYAGNERDEEGYTHAPGE